MTNHLHIACKAEAGYALSDIIRDFKKFTSKKIIHQILTNPVERRGEWIIRLLKYFAKYNPSNTTYQFWTKDNHPVELTSDLWISRRIKL